MTLLEIGVGGVLLLAAILLDAFNTLRLGRIELRLGQLVERVAVPRPATPPPAAPAAIAREPEPAPPVWPRRMMLNDREAPGPP